MGRYRALRRERQVDKEVEALVAVLQAKIGVLEAEVVRLQGRVCELVKENRELRERAEEVERLAARQAAPFRRREEKKVRPEDRKTCGRKQGHKGARREAPEAIDERIEVGLPACPHCGGKLEEVEAVKQTIEELPRIRPRVIELVTYRGVCPRCGRVRSSHPMQTTTAGGAAGRQLGPVAKAWVVALNKEYGLTMRKTSRILKGLTGLKISAGGISQIVTRAAARMKRRYEELVEEVRGSRAVFADETSWWVGTPGWWLWVFTTRDATVYRIDESRGSQVVRETLGDRYKGMLVSDCLGSYDPVGYAKHKCIAHHLRAISEAMEDSGTKDRGYLERWRGFFLGVITLYKARGSLSPEQFEELRGNLKVDVEKLLSEAITQESDLRIRKRLSKQREHLMGCLYEQEAEPTNNRAERALRPAVIARKVSCGNKTVSGKSAWEILVSLAVTCGQRSQNFVNLLASQLSLEPAITR